MGTDRNDVAEMGGDDPDSEIQTLLPDHLFLLLPSLSLLLAAHAGSPEQDGRRVCEAKTAPEGGKAKDGGNDLLPEAIRRGTRFARAKQQ